jgi:ribulose-phosphate 3-epimerase
LNPATSIEAVEEILELVDVIQVMTVNPGGGGREFIQSELDKVRRLKKMLDEKNLRIPIAVDGGINPQTAPLAVKAGARVLVAGSSVFNSNAPVAENIAALRASVKGVLEG